MKLHDEFGKFNFELNKFIEITIMIKEKSKVKCLCDVCEAVIKIGETRYKSERHVKLCGRCYASVFKRNESIT